VQQYIVYPLFGIIFRFETGESAIERLAREEIRQGFDIGKGFGKKYLYAFLNRESFVIHFSLEIAVAVLLYYACKHRRIAKKIIRNLQLPCRHVL